MTDPLQCTSCGICIGPDYILRFPEYVGDKPICYFCYKRMEKDGFIQINDLNRLFPDGRIVLMRSGKER